MLKIIIGIFCIYNAIRALTGITGLNSVISLIGVFIGVTIGLIADGRDFMGLVVIIVYVGAVAVLFMFVIMMIGEDSINNSVKALSFQLLGLLVIVYKLLEENIMNKRGYVMDKVLSVDWIKTLDEAGEITSVGEYLYTEGILNVLVAGVLLLVAMISGVYLGKDEHIKATFK